MDNLVFSLQATIPVFLMMVLGYVFRILGLLGKETAEKMNGFVFRITLPVLLFSDLAELSLREAWDGRFVLFCFCATLLSTACAVGISFLVREKSVRGEFIQASYRSSAGILGIAFISNIYGSSAMTPLMIIGSVPLYNIMAVVVLSFFRPGRDRLDGALIRKTLKGVVTNPIILGIAAGLVWSALKIPMPVILRKTVSSLGGITSPMGLMAMGAAFEPRQTFGRPGPVIAAALIKLTGFCLLFLPIAVSLGFRTEKLVAILIMLGSATTVSAYVMARNMGHDGSLTSGVVMLTTLLSAFTLTFWLWLLRSLGFL